MTNGKWEDGTWGSGPVSDVLVVLFAGSSAGAVARAAMREAGGRGARLRFIQVHHDADAAAENEVTFSAALRALREFPRQPVTFEAVEYGKGLGDLLVERSSRAAVLVLGTGSDAEHALAAHCRRAAKCDVLLARDPLAEADGSAEVAAHTS